MSYFRNISRSMELHRLYDRMFQDYLFRGINTNISPEDRENAFTRPNAHLHYFNTGSDALRLIIDGLIQGLYDPPETILDFPSGSGRVTRHLRSFFSAATITACDLYDFHYKFCAACFEIEGSPIERELRRSRLR